MPGGRHAGPEDFAVAFTGLLEAAGLSPDDVVRRLGGEGVKRSSLYDWKKGSHLPEDADLLLAVVRTCREAAERRGRVPGRNVRRDEEWVSLLAEAKQTRDSRAGRTRRPRTPGASRPGKPIGELDPAELGVHRAIRADGQDTARPEELTVYLERAHDHRLRSRLREAASGESVLAVLVGSSCTGKTRALYEAVTTCLPDWRLLVPRGARELMDWVDQDAIGARRVVWLDETQWYLPEAAGHLAVLLDRVRPLAVVGSMWLEDWQDLTEPGPRGDGQAPGPHAKRLIEVHRPHIGVAACFDTVQMEKIGVLARGDGRLQAAVRAGQADGRVLQHLTGGPELAGHLDEDDGFFSPVEHAVIIAALDARRLGHDSPIPAPLLAEAAAGTLAGTLRVSDDPDHIATVLRALCDDQREDDHRKRIPGALSVLTASRLAPGFGPAEGYRPADYLDQDARTARRFTVPPDAFWDAARHARTPGDLKALAGAAERRWRTRHAARLYQQAADAGDISALTELARMLEQAGDHEGAERAARQAADAGDIGPLMSLARSREEAGDRKSSERLYQHAGDIGNTSALVSLIRLREEAGDRAGAERAARQAADAGDTEALEDLAASLEKAGNHEDAERLAGDAANAGNRWALARLALLREEAGHHEVAERLARQAAGVGNTGALIDLARSRRETGDRADAERLYRQAIDAADFRKLMTLADFRLYVADVSEKNTGDDPRIEWLARNVSITRPLIELAELREKAGDRADAERLYQRAADITDPQALTLRDLATSREKAGDREGAEQYARQAADEGHDDVLLSLAQSRREAGDYENAERPYRLAAGAGNRRALDELADMLQEAGDPEGAERAARQAAEAGDTHALTYLAWSRGKAGDYENAERLYRQAADAGDTGALSHVPMLLEKAGRPEDAERLARQISGSYYALTELAKSRGETDTRDRHDAERHAADAGDPYPLMKLAWLQEKAGHHKDAERLARLAADVGDADALGELASVREEVGQREDAERLARQAADVGYTHPLLNLARSRQKTGDRQSAERLDRERFDRGATSASRPLTMMREEAGDHQGAERIARQAADAGDTWALRFLALSRQEDPRWRRLLRYGLEADGRTSAPW